MDIKVVNGEFVITDYSFDFAVIGDELPPEMLEIVGKVYECTAVYENDGDWFAHYVPRQTSGMLGGDALADVRENPMDEDLLSSVTVTVAARMAGVTVQAIRDALKAGKFPGAFREPNPNSDKWRIPRKDIEAYKPRKR